jgi:poly(hydroxyalkanoate) depolymerase family esterase
MLGKMGNMSIVRVAWVLWLACAGVASAAAPSASGATIRSTYDSLTGPLDYQLYLPARHLRAAPLPLVVALHGCHQGAELFSEISGFNQLADREGFAVLYPEQSGVRNTDRCWNWFLPVNQGHGVGEAEMIAGATAQVVTRFGLDANRVYVAGLSSGAAMTSILASCYPGIFAAAAVHSGLEYLAAVDGAGAQFAIAHGSQTSPSDAARMAFFCSGGVRRRMPVIIIHGTEDPRVVALNGDQVFRQFAMLNDYLDDGVANGSVPQEPTRVFRASVPGGHAYIFEDIQRPDRVLIRKVTVEGMAHAWSGGAAGYPNSDPLGPSATEMIWEFFSQ